MAPPSLSSGAFAQPAPAAFWLTSEFQKYRLRPDPNQQYIPCRPVPLRGAARDVTDAGRDAVDAAARLTGVACSGRRRRVVLMPRRRHQVCKSFASDGGKKADHRGEHGISRKPLRGECRVIPVTRCEYSCAYLLPHAHTRLRVHRAPGIPHALCFRRARNSRTTRAKSRRGNADPRLKWRIWER